MRLWSNRSRLRGERPNAGRRIAFTVSINGAAEGGNTLETQATGSFEARKHHIFTRLFDSKLSISILSILLSLVVLAIFSLLYGTNPLYVIISLFEGAFNGELAIISTLTQTAPLILTALAVYIPNKVGFFNVGGQGQLEVAALAAVFVGTNIACAPFWAMIVMMLVSMLVGVLAILLPLVLKAKRGTNEVTTTIMMNFACLNLVNALVTGTLKDPDAFYGTTKSIPAEYFLPSIPAGSGLHIGILFCVLIAIAVGWYIKNTTGGFKLKATGLNRKAAMVAGMDVKSVTFRAVLLGGALAGLAGGMQMMGVTHRVALGWSMSWGFTGVSIAFLATSPIAVILVSIFMASLDTGARYMQAMTGIPSPMISIMQGIPVIIFVALSAYNRIRKLKVSK